MQDDFDPLTAAQKIVKGITGVQRFWSHVIKSDGCWNWATGKDKDGYGQFSLLHHNVRAHRFSYLLNVGPIPQESPDVLHKCDNPSCVNPAHLFLGTHADNNKDRDLKCRTAKGAKSGVRLHPESLKRGDDHWTRRNPELVKRGKDAWISSNQWVHLKSVEKLKLHPELRPRGEKHWTRAKKHLVKRGDLHAQAILTTEQVLAIRNEYVPRVVTAEFLGKKYGVSKGCVLRILWRKIWTHV